MYEAWHIVTTPKILNDTVFVQYGGQTGTSTPAQRTAAYCIAETQAALEVGAPLTATIITGTFPWPVVGHYPTYDMRFQLPHQRVMSIASVVGIHDAGCNCASDAVEMTGCAWIVDGDNGVIDLRECGGLLKGGCACNSAGIGPFQFRVVYTAGLPTGTVQASPMVMMGLVTAADLALQQVISPGCAEGGPGDPQVTQYSDTGYSETRGALRMTAFGGSARANYAANMLSVLKVSGGMKL